MDDRKREYMVRKALIECVFCKKLITADEYTRILKELQGKYKDVLEAKEM